MTFRTSILKIIRLTFYALLILFILDIFDLFQTKISVLKTLIYYGVMLLPIPILIIEFIIQKSLKKAVFRKLIPMSIIFGIIYLNPIKILFHKQPWKTQTIEHVLNKNHKIEQQIKDIGALGYAKRRVEVYELSPYFYLILNKNSSK